MKKEHYGGQPLGAISTEILRIFLASGPMTTTEFRKANTKFDSTGGSLLSKLAQRGYLDAKRPAGSFTTYSISDRGRSFLEAPKKVWVPVPVAPKPFVDLVKSPTYRPEGAYTGEVVMPRRPGSLHAYTLPSVRGSRRIWPDGREERI